MARVASHEAISARLPDRLTWSPPRGVAAVFPDRRFAGFRPRNLRNQRVISPFECISGAPVAANEVPGGVKHGARARGPGRAAPRQFPARPAQGRAAQPDLQDRAQRPGAHQRQARQARSPRRRRRRDPDSAGRARASPATCARRRSRCSRRLGRAASCSRTRNLLALEQAQRPRRARRQRHQLRRDRGAARAAPGASPSSWCTASTATPPACW